MNKSLLVVLVITLGFLSSYATYKYFHKDPIEVTNEQVVRDTKVDKLSIIEKKTYKLKKETKVPLKSGRKRTTQAVYAPRKTNNKSLPIRRNEVLQTQGHSRTERDGN